MTEQRYQCPLCGSTSYQTVYYHRDGRQPVKLPMYSCIGCSVLFTDPWLFVAGDRDAYQKQQDYREKDDPREVRARRNWKPGKR